MVWMAKNNHKEILICIVGSFLLWVYFNLYKENIKIIERTKVFRAGHGNIAKVQERPNVENKTDIPNIYIVTATYSRLAQKADLTRLSYTLRLVPNIHWIVVEDADNKTELVRNFLFNSKLQFIHLNKRTPNVKNRWEIRGISQRNEAVRWIRQFAQTPGVVYFADDDNTYDIRIFEEMRYTKNVSVWPVGLVAGLRYEAPKVSNKKVVGWHTSFPRKFSTDMAGFAVNLQLLKNITSVEFRASAPPGHHETDFIQQLGVELSDLEPLAANCTKVLVWHTRTQKPNVNNESKVHQDKNYTSDPIEV
ncbi:galactosylgalactosylxylosylprotein 3-beta-glucuronosyltransferase 2-like [Mya arenaria]|uniref:galactosylgalactosylxylosylprotein 3-beta-glucuronosyltransferase 2-like n=1 Tax=Mya arenaria TaxID=6604 RepID=UPI0022E73FB2|nr:galactosylgalactosylxylosylprotein 3-beta-glucuronosyltransferase 2-like [Mya arenaria]